MAGITIGTLLLSANILTQEQYDECVLEQTRTGIPLDQIIVEKGYATEVDIARTYAQYAHLPFVTAITEKMADQKLLAKIPLKYLRDNAVIPVMQDSKIVVLSANPLDFEALDSLNLLLGSDISYAVAPRSQIISSINRYYPLEGTQEMIEELQSEEKGIEDVSFEQIEEKDILSMASEAPIIKLVNHLLFQAVKQDASDIHIEPFEKELRVRYRVDGIMHTAMNPPKRVQNALVSRIKIMAHLNIAEKRLPQDGRIQIKIADKPIDIRVSVLPVAYGERIVLRLLDKSRSFGSLEELGMSKRDLTLTKQSIEQPNGIIFVTGPTGSGKTTTLYSLLSALNKPGVNIITVEDPVEYQMSGIGQVQVKEKVGLTFAIALRSILRQDPDIVMIGETRDQETAQIAIQAALTGHLVLSTLHTNSAPATITRLIDMGIEPFLIASSVVIAIAQRLVRRLCKECKKPYTPSPDLIEQLGISPQESKRITFYQAQGCAECMTTGYKGRLPIFEVMAMTAEIAHLTMQKADTMVLRRQAIRDGMTTLLVDGIEKIKAGLTTIDEVLAVATMEQREVD
jgi:general secretion pathway protein E